MPPLLNRRALLALGFSPALIVALLGKPDQVAQRKRGYMHWVEHLYARERVEQAMLDPRFLALVAKRQARAAKAAERMAAIPTRYAGWRAALPEACEGMYQLNRYAKHHACGPMLRQEVYGLKNELIAMLYRHGYCSAAWLHKLPEQICRACAGEGDWCGRCDGSGVWRGAATIWCFRFRIAGKAYVWHQPRDMVAFAVEETLAPQDWIPGVREKAVVLPRSRFAEAKELLRWVIARAAAEEPVEEVCPFEWWLEKAGLVCLNEHGYGMSMRLYPTVDKGVA